MKNFFRKDIQNYELASCTFHGRSAISTCGWSNLQSNVERQFYFCQKTAEIEPP